MILTVDTKTLLDALKVAAKVTPTRCPKPVLRCVVIDAGLDGATLFASDLELGVEIRLAGVRADLPGRIAVDADELKRLLPTPKESPSVTLLADDGELTVATDVGDFGCDLDDPALHPSHEWDRDRFAATPLAFAHTGELAAALLACSDHTDPDSTRYALAGILIEPDRETDAERDARASWDVTGRLALVATDGRRLMIERLDCAFGANLAASYWREQVAESWIAAGRPDQNVVLLAGHCKRIADLVKKGEKSPFAADVVALCRASDSASVLRCGDLTFRLRHVEGRFPNWRAVLPGGWAVRWELDLAETRRAFERAAKLCSKEARGVDVTVADARMLLEAESPTARGRRWFRGDVPAPGLERFDAADESNPALAVDAGYMLDGLKAFERSGVTDARCRYVDRKSALVIDARRGSRPGPSYVVMPLNRDR